MKNSRVTEKDCLFKLFCILKELTLKEIFYGLIAILFGPGFFGTILLIFSKQFFEIGTSTFDHWLYWPMILAKFLLTL